MGKLFNLEIISPDEVIYKGKVSSLVAPSVLGYLGVLANHAPLVANLTQGKITLREESGGVKVFSSSAKGILEVLKNNVTVILH